MTLRSRRRLAWVLFAGAAVVVCYINYVLRIRLQRVEIVSGLALFALIILLTLFNVRKKLPFLPLLPASTWMQVHIYVGLLSFVVCLLHTGWRIPQGGLELALAILFYLVAMSGVLGLAISRWLPGHLTVLGENVIFERIPALRAGLRQDVQEMVLQSVGKLQSSTIADFYEMRLHPYFLRPRSQWHHLRGSGKPLAKLLSEVQALDRYLNGEERAFMTRIVEKIHAKNNLDYQQARQGLLKAWLFIHIPLTYAMIIVAVVHGFLAWKLS
jgi:hypothetical protein